MARAAVIVLWQALLGMTSLASGQDQAGEYVIQTMIYANVLSVQIQLQAVQDAISSLNEKISTVDVKIAALEERLNGLEHRVTELLTNNAERSTAPLTSSEETTVVTPPSTRLPQESTTPAETEGPLVMRRVRQEETQLADSRQVSVQFDATDPPSVVLANNVVWLEDGRELPVEKPGTVEFDTDTRSQNVILMFQLPDKMQLLSLNLKDTHASMDIPSVVIDVPTAQDEAVAFDNEHQTHLRYSVRVSGETEGIRSLGVSHKMMVKSQTEANVVNIFHESSDLVWVETVQENTTYDDGRVTNNRQVSIVVNSTAKDVEGILLNIYATVIFNCSHNCLVSQLYGLFKSVPFYRKGHTNPFTDGFISFIDKDNSGSQQYCYTGGLRDSKVCRVKCLAFGTERLTMHLSPAEASDQRGAFRRPTKPYLEEWTIAELVFDNVTTKASGNYLCTAKSRSGTIRRMITLHVVQSPVIDTTASRMIRFENGSASVTCVAHGVPAPAVTLATYVEVLGVVEKKQYAYDVTQLNHNTTQAQLFFPASEVGQRYFEVDCLAQYRQDGGALVTKDFLSLN